MNNDWAFLTMTDSAALLGDPAALRARMDEDGYLLLRNVLDPERLLKVRRRVLEVLARHEWIQGAPVLMRARSLVRPVREDDASYADVYDDVQRVEAFHELAHDERLLEIMRQVVGDTAFPHPLKIVRIVFPAHHEASTPPHQDHPNNQGTPSLTASWIPLGDCPRSMGGLAVLRGSHRFGELPLAFDLGPGNRRAVLPPEMEGLRWVTTDYAIGDVLLFPSLTVHAALHNASDFFLRLSADFRFQREGDDLSDLVLQPHFGRLSWDEVYEGWSDSSHRYYWHDLDLREVAFDPDRLALPDGQGELGQWERYRHGRRHRFSEYAEPGVALGESGSAHLEP